MVAYLGRALLTLTVLLALLTGCVTDGEIDNVAKRRATWFSFLSGEDIAAECRASGREQYRLTYIADRSVQVRIYDIDADATPSALQRSRIMTVAASDWFPMAIFQDPTRPFTPVDSVAPIPAATLDTLRQSLLNAGWSTQPPPVGKKIASFSYSWLVAGCRNGRFAFQAWEYPDDNFEKLNFPNILFAGDTSDIRIQPVPTDGQRRVHDPRIARPGYNAREDQIGDYNMLVGEMGVVGTD